MNFDTSLPLTAAVTEFALGTQLPLGEEVPTESVIHPFVDALGVFVAGASTEVADAMRAALPHLSATIEPGQPLRGPHGALVLGTMGHALDYDDSVPLMPGHPSVPVLAAMMAMPAPGVDGNGFLQAYAVGVEVAAKVGKAAGGGHYRRGWHATSTHGCLGAVAALGRLHQVSPEELRTALGIAVSGLSGVQVNFGTMTKPLHAGLAAQRAVEAIELARHGVTATQYGLESPQGYFDVYGTEKSDPALLLSELGSPWAFVEPGIYLKRYPCCYATHRAIAGVRDLMQDPAVTADSVERIDVRVPIGGLRPLRAHHPTTGLEGKFSLEYTIAATLVDGSVGLRSFEDEAVNRPPVQSLISRTTVAETVDCCPDDPEGVHGSAGTRGFVHVRLGLRDGTVQEREIHTPPGAREFKLTTAEVSEKFLDCLVSSGVADSAARELLDTFLTIPQQADPADALAAIRTYCAAATTDQRN